jgi:hypothetical protein
MQSERRWFLTYVGIGMFAVYCVFLIGTAVTEYRLRGVVNDSRTIARMALRDAAAQLLSQSEPVSAYVAVHELLLTSLEKLQNNTKAINTAARLLVFTAHYVPFHSIPNTPQPQESVTVLTMTEQFRWLSTAIPALRRIADYDVVADIQNSPNNKDLFRRVYAARLGLMTTLGSIENPPASLVSDDIVQIIRAINNSIASSEPLIRALDTGSSSDVFLREFITTNTASSRLSGETYKRLTGEPFVKSLLSRLQ